MTIGIEINIAEDVILLVIATVFDVVKDRAVSNGDCVVAIEIAKRETLGYTIAALEVAFKAMRSIICSDAFFTSNANMVAPSSLRNRRGEKEERNAT